MKTSSEPLTAPAAEQPCALYKDHGSAVPAVTQGHHIYPVYLQNRVYGQIRKPDLMYLCGTCHDNLHAWLYWLLQERRKPNPEPPYRARAAALHAFNWYTTAHEEKNSG